MKIMSVVLVAAILAMTALALAEGEEEVSFTDLIAKASDYEGKTIRLSCSVLYAGSEVLAVEEVTEEDGAVVFKGEAIYLKRFKSSLKKKLAKGKYKKKTCYYGPTVLTGEIKTGQFGRKKEYKIQLTIKTAEVSGGSGSSEGFKLLKKNKRTTTDVPDENAIRSARQAVARDGFNPPTYPKYHDGSNLAANTQVLCVTYGKESKVYTIGSLGTCELVNDKIGNVPIAVTW